MPLESRQGGDISKSRMCGVEIGFKSSITDAIRFNIEHGPFDLILAPLMYPGYVPKEDNDPNCQILDQRLLPYAGSDFHVSCGQWSGLVVGKISPWLDLDSEDETTRMEAETILRKQIEWASYLSIKACVLPTPKGSSCANYARCVNQILQSKNNMQLLVRFPFGMSDDDDSPRSNALVDSSWQTWNSFRLLCDYHNQLLIVLDIMRVLPPENSQKRWYGEPVTAAILDSDMFLTKARGNTVYLPKRHQKLIGDFLGHDIQIIISGLKVLGEAQFTAEGSKPHPLLPYRDQVSNIYKQIVPPSEQQRPEFGIRDFLQLPLLPFRNYTNAQSYQTWELDQVKYINYEIAICKALQDRVSDEKASEITTVLVVVGAGRGPLVRSSLQAAQRAGRKLRVYAVEKNPQAAIALDELIRTNNWSSFVIIVSSDVRNWNAPERADILVSDLLGSFGDNELSPESLDSAQRFLQKDGISIPSSYTSFLQPLTASKLYKDAKEKKEILHSESACVVNMHKVARLAPCQQVFTFTHPKCFDGESNQRYQKLCFVIPNNTGSAMVHGFAGYFNATLYKDVFLRTEPSTATQNLKTWFPMFFPLRTPICVDSGSHLEVHFWRCVDYRKVWYEWCVTSPSSSPIHNCNGRSCWMDL
ncbi:protein arginine N-methyltransferase 1.5 [Trifolium repens]|nr:protein arginine N-methyltransferase 1.5 [Trifolium repens]